MFFIAYRCERENGTDLTKHSDTFPFFLHIALSLEIERPSLVNFLAKKKNLGGHDHNLKSNQQLRICSPSAIPLHHGGFAVVQRCDVKVYNTSTLTPNRS